MIGVALAGCVHQPDVASFKATCAGLGLAAGTPEMAQCVQNEAAMDLQRREAMASILMQGTHNAFPAPAPIARPLTCMTNSGITSCY